MDCDIILLGLFVSTLFKINTFFDRILNLTQIKCDLSLICRYFNDNCKAIRITSNFKYLS